MTITEGTLNGARASLGAPLLLLELLQACSRVLVRARGEGTAAAAGSLPTLPALHCTTHATL